MTEPNIYTLHNPALGVHVVYSTGAGGAIPGLQYRDLTISKDFKSTDLRKVDTDLGTLVSVTLIPSVDSGSTSFTLLVPRVNLGPSRVAPVATDGVRTVHRFSIVPAFNQGQLDLYTVIPLAGTAEFIAF